eukprot:6599751-Pyramimonas_sp.AAC.1
MAKYHSTLHSGCLSAAKHSNLPTVDGLSGKRTYSGVILEANARGGNEVSAVVKVAAHKDPDESGVDAFGRFCRECNKGAGAAAESALSL